MGAFPKPRSGLSRRLAVAIVLSLAAASCALPHLRLPNERPTIPPLPQTSRILDDRGNLITTLDAGEDRTLIPISEVPVVTRDAVIAAEDERFFSHHGVDVKAIIRAALANAKSGHIVQGGSTITEQLVKNTIGTDERTLGRKIREAEIAWALEDRYTKLQILELYMNTVYFGQGAYGIEAAAKTYFSIPASSLDVGQSALLAGLISSPSKYDPVFHPDSALAQRNIVLGRMRDLRMIAPSAYRAAVASPLGLDLAKPVKRYPAPYFVDYVKRWFLNNPAFGATYQERYNRLFEGGLRIHTTVDLRLQRDAEQAINSILRYKTDPYGAMTVIDPRNGSIRAMVGGRDYFSSKDRFAQLNLATGGATGRQAGSAFKVFALVTALNQGISPEQVYPAPTHIDIRLPPGYHPSIWPVDNYDGEGGGAMTLEQATINSVNTVYAQVIMQVGAQHVVDTAHAMGMTRPLLAVPSAVLGTNDVDTLQMASAYGTLATIGRHAPPTAVTEVEDAGGRVIYRADQTAEEVVAPGVAWIADQILQKVVQTGTGSQANIGRPAAGKTGTAQKWTNAWFVGFIPQLVAAVWVGFPQGQIQMAAPRVRIPHVLGGTWPAEIWHAFMTNATRYLPVRDFPKPSFGYVAVPVDYTRGCLPNHWTLPQDIQVVTYISGTQPTIHCTQPAGPQVLGLPSVVGMNVEQAQQLLSSYAFETNLVLSNAPGVAGSVISQDPAPGTWLTQGATVTLTVIQGTAPPSPTPSPSPLPTPTPTESPPPSPTPSPTPTPSPSPT